MARIVPSLEDAPRDSLRYLMAVAIVVTALYVGAEIFVPIALAILLSFVLAPGVRLLHRWHLGRVVPVMLMTALAFTVILGLASLLVTQLRDLANDLPRYESTVVSKVESLRGLTSGEGMSRFSQFVTTLKQRLHSEQGGAPDGATTAKPAPPPTQGASSGSPLAAGPESKPIPVIVEQPEEMPLELAGRYLAPALHPVVLGGLVAIYVVFMLLQREDLRNRAIRLFGAGDLHRSTAAIDDAARRLSRYLGSQIAVNTGAGLVIGIGLELIGVPSPILFGILFGCLRFVPYVGPPLAAVAPLALAAAVSPGWGLVLWAAGLFVVVESIVGQAVEPLLYGHNTGLSPVAVVIAATFWTALWGPVGLVLATPMTVCLVVLGRHVEPLAFLDVMLGDTAPLSPPEVFYQRMLAGDPVEASDQAERILKDKTLTDYYDEVLLPALLLAQDDISQGRLDGDRQERIATAAGEVIENLSEQDDNPTHKPAAGLLDKIGRSRAGTEQGDPTPSTEVDASASPSLAEDWARPGAVLCIGGRGPLDDAAAAALAQVMGKHGFGAAAAGHEMLAKGRIAELAVEDARLICLSCLDGSSAAYLRFILRRLNRRDNRIPVLVGAWWRQGAQGAAEASDPIASRDSVSTMAEAVAHGLRLAAASEPDRASGDGALSDATAAPVEAPGSPSKKA